MHNCQISRNSIELSNTAEVKMICKKLRNCKAPGLDRIHNTLIKQLPAHGILYLTIIINACLTLTYFPIKWRHAQMIAIKKPQKPSHNPSSYRPISLLSSISKILERVVLKRLQKHLDDNNIIPHFQHGFRANRSTTTQLYNVTAKIKSGFHQRLPLSTGMVLIDIEKAFDRVWHHGLLYKLIKTNTPKYIIKILASFLESRSFAVKVGNSTSPTVDITFGVPQGAVMSPTLYNVFTHDVPQPEDCEVAQFADDTAFFKSSRYAKTITQTLERTFNKYQRYYKLWKIKVNNDKTQAIFFSKRRTKQLPQIPLKAGDSNIEWSNEVKYLGLVLDKKLTYRQHVNYVAEKTLKAMRILYSMLNRKSKLDQSNKLLLLKVCLRPISTYAAPILVQAAKTHLRKLQVIQNKILRMILDAPWWTRTTTLHENTELEMIADFIQRLTDNFHARTMEDD